MKKGSLVDRLTEKGKEYDDIMLAMQTHFKRQRLVANELKEKVILASNAILAAGFMLPDEHRGVIADIFEDFVSTLSEFSESMESIYTDVVVTEKWWRESIGVISELSKELDKIIARSKD